MGIGAFFRLAKNGGLSLFGTTSPSIFQGQAVGDSVGLCLLRRMLHYYYDYSDKNAAFLAADMGDGC